MATAFTGESVVGIANIDGSTTSGTIYTVPAGRYAKVRIIQIMLITSVPLLAFGGSLNVSGIPLASSNFLETTSGSRLFQQDTILESGDTISISGGTANVRASILEFANP